MKKLGLQSRQEARPAKQRKTERGNGGTREASVGQIRWPNDHPTIRRTDQIIMDLIVVDMLPYSVVNIREVSRKFVLCN